MAILHAPSNPEAKGTAKIISAIDSLKSTDKNFELILLEDQGNLEGLQAIRECDFVINKLYPDTHMAGFPCEAAWFGKPAIVGGYAFIYLEKYTIAGTF